MVYTTRTPVLEHTSSRSCDKSIFNWSVTPDSNGRASIDLYLCSMTECNSLVWDSASDLTSPLTGQALLKVNDGMYFIASDNPGQNWSVTWECKD